MSAIFISYRRDDSEGSAGRICAELKQSFGEKAVFLDVTAIRPGHDYRQALNRNLASCKVLLAVIGRNWAGRGEAGRLRLEDATDYVRLEIAAALKRRIPVVPVLVQGGSMPSEGELTEDIRALAYSQGVRLTLEDWDSGIQRLIEGFPLRLRARRQWRSSRRTVAEGWRAALALRSVRGVLGFALGLGFGLVPFFLGRWRVRYFASLFDLDQDAMRSALLVGSAIFMGAVALTTQLGFGERFLRAHLSRLFLVAFALVLAGSGWFAKACNERVVPIHIAARNVDQMWVIGAGPRRSGCPCDPDEMTDDECLKEFMDPARVERCWGKFPVQRSKQVLGVSYLTMTGGFGLFIGLVLLRRTRELPSRVRDLSSRRG